MHDSTADCGCGCGCGGSGCGTMPAEFVRVRYYFGQRLGVLELSDEAIYHAGKLAFHNARLHGFGVVCGMRAERVKPPASTGTKSTVLRVVRGAALDPCGREIVVGIDQCIDVAAWFAKNRSRPALSGWTAGTTQTLRVALRYRECPSDPGPAPRDPCGCDNGGCEFGRVREGFELGLFAGDELRCATGSFPDTASLIAAVHGASVRDSGDASRALAAAIDGLVAADCPGCTDDLWLCLATFDVVLDATPVPVDITDPDNAIPERRSLLSTSALQAAVLDLLADGAASGALGAGGPRAGALAFTPDAASPTKAGTLALPIALAASGSPPAPVPIVDATFDPAIVRVEALDTAAGWKDITPPAANVTLDTAVTPPALTVVFAQDLSVGPTFRLTVDPPFAAPVADAEGHPLARVARHFRFVAVDAAGTLGLAPSA